MDRALPDLKTAGTSGQRGDNDTIKCWDRALNLACRAGVQSQCQAH